MRKKTSTKNYCSSNWPTRCELFVVCWFLNRESVNCKLTSVHLILQCVFMSFFLRTGGWLRHYNTTDFFFRFIDCWTGINKRALLYHFLFLSRSHPLLPLVFILHSLCTSLISHFILWCSCYPSASCVSFGLSSWGLWWNGVRSPHQKEKK